MNIGRPQFTKFILPSLLLPILNTIKGNLILKQMMIPGGQIYTKGYRVSGAEHTAPNFSNLLDDTGCVEIGSGSKEHLWRN